MCKKSITKQKRIKQTKQGGYLSRGKRHQRANRAKNGRIPGERERRQKTRFRTKRRMKRRLICQYSLNNIY